jgi:hypothetical protein
MTQRQIKKCIKIAEHYGRYNQERQAVSELAELEYVLTRRPEQRKPNWKDNLLDEIADVTVMLTQLSLLYGLTPEEIADRIDFKLDRQLDRIKNE